MEDGYYRRRDLQIDGLAAKLKVPEHQLRRLINQHLGYRNFSSFLNHHRIREAQSHLENAETVRVPVLTIAMDLLENASSPEYSFFRNSI